jgi:hypothetical protein
MGGTPAGPKRVRSAILSSSFQWCLLLIKAFFLKIDRRLIFLLKAVV